MWNSRPLECFPTNLPFKLLIGFIGLYEPEFFFFFSVSGHSPLFRLSVVLLWHVKASQPQVWGHGPLCKVLPDPEVGGAWSGGRSLQSWGGQQGLESCSSGLGVTTPGSFRLYSSWLDRFTGMALWEGLRLTYTVYAAIIPGWNIQFYVVWRWL